MIKEAYEKLTGIDARSVEKRRVLCVTCPDHKTVMGVGQCGKCGCVIKFKTAYGPSVCPTGRWLAHVPVV